MSKTFWIWFCRLYMVIGILNFLALVYLSFQLKGDAINGKVLNGLFYVGSHGKYTQVTQAQFNFSLWHIYSVAITHPLLMVAIYFEDKLVKASKKQPGRPETFEDKKLKP